MQTDQPATKVHSADEPLYVARVAVTAAPEPEPHAIFGHVFEPELTPLPPTAIAPGLDAAMVRVRALDQLVTALAG